MTRIAGIYVSLLYAMEQRLFGFICAAILKLYFSFLISWSAWLSLGYSFKNPKFGINTINCV